MSDTDSLDSSLFAFNNLEYSDCTIHFICPESLKERSLDDEVEGLTINVNRAILGTKSKVFRKMFEQNFKESKSKTIDLLVESSEIPKINNLIRFIYSNSPSDLEKFKNDEESLDMLLLADKFGIDSAIKVGTELIAENITFNTLKFLDMPESLMVHPGCKNLVEKIGDYLLKISQDFDKFWQTPQFLDLNFKALVNILSNSKVKASSENTIYTACKTWWMKSPNRIKNDHKNFADSLILLLECIQWQDLDPYFLLYFAKYDTTFVESCPEPGEEKDPLKPKIKNMINKYIDDANTYKIFGKEKIKFFKDLEYNNTRSFKDSDSLYTYTWKIENMSQNQDKHLTSDLFFWNGYWFRLGAYNHKNSADAVINHPEGFSVFLKLDKDENNYGENFYLSVIGEFFVKRNTQYTKLEPGKGYGNCYTFNKKFFCIGLFNCLRKTWSEILATEVDSSDCLTISIKIKNN